jgi:hypothetical protein
MQRRVEPEILDELPAGHPDAIRSRRDLRWINWIMGNHRWLARKVREHRQPDWRVLELGAGDGGFGRALVDHDIVPPESLMAIDLSPRPSGWPGASEWAQRDLFAAPIPNVEMIVANLFLHHFEAPALNRLGAAIPEECRVFLCSEPARRRLHLWQARVLSLFPMNRVTRHDMPVSIHAGFHGRDLVEALGLERWKVRVSMTLFGAYRLEALRH